MTDPQNAPSQSPRPRRHPVLSIAMFLIGVILLLPGICASFFAIGLGMHDGSLVVLWAVCVLISVGGGFLVAQSLR